MDYLCSKRLQIIIILWIYSESMISSIVYLCTLIFEKTHLDSITRQKMHCLIFIFFKTSIAKSENADRNKRGLKQSLLFSQDFGPEIGFLWSHT
jgi:hypothetical protein